MDKCSCLKRKLTRETNSCLDLAGETQMQEQVSLLKAEINMGDKLACNLCLDLASETQMQVQSLLKAEINKSDQLVLRLSR